MNEKQQFIAAQMANNGPIVMTIGFAIIGATLGTAFCAGYVAASFHLI